MLALILTYVDLSSIKSNSATGQSLFRIHINNKETPAKSSGYLAEIIMRSGFKQEWKRLIQI